MRAGAAASGVAGRAGRPPAGYCMRDVVDAIRYLTHNGPVWRALPADFPPAWTVYYWAAKWEADGSAERMHDELRDRVRLVAGRQPADGSDHRFPVGERLRDGSRARDRGYDAGKKSTAASGTSPSTTGLLLTVLVTAASVQDRDAAKPLLQNLHRAFPQITLAWADGGYAGKLVSWAKAALSLTLEIVKRPDDLHVSRCCRAGGWSSGHCRGSPTTAGPSGTTSACPPGTRPTSTGQ